MNQKQVVDALMKAETYEEDPGRIELLQTHISFVFLTKSFVYKVKKAVNFGFLDFTTLEKRRFFCQRELELNRRLCGDMYLEVVPINKSTTVKIKGKGETVEYAVKMKRMPQEKMMSNLLEENRVEEKLVDKIAKIMAEFHTKAETIRRIDEFQLDPIVEMNWNENFEQTVEFIGKTITERTFDFTHERVENFMKRNKPIFEKRIARGKVRECHGDIHSGNIFIADRVYIFDAIEFNDRISYSDVAADVGFLAMDLDFRERPDLSDFFVKKYIDYSRDRQLIKLLPFYKCYRAYVRGKVISFKLKDPHVSKKEKELAEREAKAYFKQAATYANFL